MTFAGSAWHHTLKFGEWAIQLTRKLVNIILLNFQRTFRGEGMDLCEGEFTLRGRCT